MPKYRHLTKEELIQFEKEFIDYLVVNGITGEDWQKLKEEDPDKAEGITDLFSDVVFEKIMRNVKYLTFTSKNQLLTFQCLETSIILVSMKSDEEHIDFTNNELVEQYLISPPSSIKVFTQTKDYTKAREIELFEMTEGGALMDDGKLFKALCLAL